MKIFSAEKKEDWNQFIIKEEGSFLQSLDWGEFQKSLGKKVWRFEVRRQEKTVMAAQVIKEKLVLQKSFLYLPYGPCFSSDIFLKGKKVALELLLKEVKTLAKKENCIFFKVEPKTQLPLIEGAISSPKRIQPQISLILNLDIPEEKIFNLFHPKTRYNIRLAQKRGVEVKVINFKELSQGAREKYFKKFWKLLKKTAKRKKFYLHPKEHYKNLLLFLSLEKEKIDQQKPLSSLASLLFVAEYKHRFVAANIALLFGNEMTYLHGGSNYKYRKLMTPHLLQWRQIQEARRLGFKTYDFWGVDDGKWGGISRFKRGFLPIKALKERIGEEIQYPEGKDFIFQKFWYTLYKIARKI